MIDAARRWFRRQVDERLFQLRPVETGEITLVQRRVFIVPSRPGLAFAALLLALFIGSINYSLSLGFGLTFLVTGCALVDMLMTSRNLSFLSLRAGRARPVFAGEEAQFEFVVANRRRHDRYALRAEFILREGGAVEQVFDVPAQSSQVVTLAVRTQRRGWLRAPRVRLHTRFPLGLYYCWAYWSPDAQVLVYPRPEDDAPPLPAAGAGSEDARGAAGQEDFAGVRAYQPGDSLKLLAWRQIARQSTDGDPTLISKHFEGGAAGELRLAYHRLPLRLGHEDRLSRLARWVLEAEARGLPYALDLGGTRIPASLGPEHQEACLRTLALCEDPR